jgi:phage shock protein PspC (stress-responsive transcriptional regulator)
MKKVININFQGRVIPIEETAYEMLQRYIASLRGYFANEEGRDEIINDIESRIAELFGEALKKGQPCITDEEVNRIIASMGRPEDFEEAEKQDAGFAKGEENNAGEPSGSEGPSGAAASGSRKRLYRDEEDKILGGVASGLAHYLNIDPAIIRILFAILTIFGGSGFLIYIVLWVFVPSRSLVTNIRKRLYRDPDDRVIAGVCGGLAKYFDMNPAIPRIIFAAPFIFGIITSVFRSFFDYAPFFVGSFGGGTFILAYVILWIVLPEAHTAAERLEMRGEKVDVNSIRDTVINEMQGLKGQAQRVGKEMQESAGQVGGELKRAVSEGARNVASDIERSARRRGGLGDIIATLVKAFIYFILGIIGISLFVALIALLGTGVGVLPIHDFVLQGTRQYVLALLTLVLFIGVPIISLLVWFIRRLMRVRSSSKYLGVGFTALWVLGFFALMSLVVVMKRSFSVEAGAEEAVYLPNPGVQKMQVMIAGNNLSYYDGWIDMEGVLSVDRDTLYLNTARVNVQKSKDSLFHVNLLKISRGKSREESQRLAEKITFPVVQSGDTLLLPEYFVVSKADKWRNQRVIVSIEVPVGRQIRIDDRVQDYNYFAIEFGGRRNRRIQFNRSWEGGLDWRSDRDLRMTPDGLERMDGELKQEKGNEWNEEKNEPNQGGADSGYRYQRTIYREKMPAPAAARRPRVPVGPLASVMTRI